MVISKIDFQTVYLIDSIGMYQNVKCFHITLTKRQTSSLTGDSSWNHNEINKKANYGYEEQLNFYNQSSYVKDTNKAEI